MSRFPFGIPNSWYFIAFSDDLRSGDVRRLAYLDRELVAFRGESGQVAVLDAHCPHLGAHLGVGGKVVGDTIECPFHGWRWNSKGRCEAIPYAKRIPAQAEGVSYPVSERNGMIFVWYHGDRIMPTFEIPDIPEWGREEWLAKWLSWDWTINTHPQEMAENGIDWPHFETVHKMDVPSDRTFAFEPNYYMWQVGGTKAMDTLDRKSDEVTMYGENWGLGYNWIRQTGRFETIVATGLTPIDAETTHVRMCVIARLDDRAESEVRNELEGYMAEHAVFAEQDFEIWENKKYRAKPPLCEADGPITEFRRWASQFY